MTITQPTIDRLMKDQKGKCANCWRTVPPMESWHASIPMLIKDQFIYLGGEKNV